MSFRSILENAQSRSNSTLAIGFAPEVNELPLEIQRFDDPFLPFAKAVIDATQDLVCAYVFHLASYLALGAAGAIALERSIAYIPVDIVKILHAPFASADFVRTASKEAFAVDAVTLTAGSDPFHVTPYVTDVYHGVFVEAPHGYDARPLLKLNEDYPGQIGIYKSVEAKHNTLSVFFEPYPEIHWYWGKELYAGQKDQDFREVIRANALKLRQKPTL